MFEFTRLSTLVWYTVYISSDICEQWLSGKHFSSRSTEQCCSGRHTAKDRLLKEPLCSYSAWITWTFKLAKQAHTRVTFTPQVMYVWSFSFHEEVYIWRKMWHFRKAWWNVSPLCCTSHPSTAWHYTTFWKKETKQKCICGWWGKV